VGIGSGTTEGTGPIRRRGGRTWEERRDLREAPRARRIEKFRGFSGRGSVRVENAALPRGCYPTKHAATSGALRVLLGTPGTSSSERDEDNRRPSPPFRLAPAWRARPADGRRLRKLGVGSLAGSCPVYSALLSTRACCDPVSSCMQPTESRPQLPSRAFHGLGRLGLAQRLISIHRSARPIKPARRFLGLRASLNDLKNDWRAVRQLSFLPHSEPVQSSGAASRTLDDLCRPCDTGVWGRQAAGVEELSQLLACRNAPAWRRRQLQAGLPGPALFPRPLDVYGAVRNSNWTEQQMLVQFCLLCIHLLRIRACIFGR
jgi:hypothetical protein